MSSKADARVNCPSCRRLLIPATPARYGDRVTYPAGCLACGELMLIVPSTIIYQGKSGYRCTTHTVAAYRMDPDRTAKAYARLGKCWDKATDHDFLQCAVISDA